MFLLLFTDYEAIVKLSDGFNGADLRNVCTEAGELLKSEWEHSGICDFFFFFYKHVWPLLFPPSPIGMFAIRAFKEYVTQEDFMKAVRKVADSKKLESKLDYKPV